MKKRFPVSRDLTLTESWSNYCSFVHLVEPVCQRHWSAIQEFAPSYWASSLCHPARFLLQTSFTSCFLLLFFIFRMKEGTCRPTLHKQGCSSPDVSCKRLIVWHIIRWTTIVWIMQCCARKSLSVEKPPYIANQGAGLVPISRSVLIYVASQWMNDGIEEDIITQSLGVNCWALIVHPEPSPSYPLLLSIRLVSMSPLYQSVGE